MYLVTQICGLDIDPADIAAIAKTGPATVRAVYRVGYIEVVWRFYCLLWNIGSSGFVRGSVVSSFIYVNISIPQSAQSCGHNFFFISGFCHPTGNVANFCPTSASRLPSLITVGIE